MVRLAMLSSVALAVFAITAVTGEPGAAPTVPKVQSIHNCVSKKPGVENNLLRYCYAILECINGGRDNRACCRKEVIEGKCLRLCNGAPGAEPLGPEGLHALKDCPKKAYKCLDIKLY